MKFMESMRTTINRLKTWKSNCSHVCWEGMIFCQQTSAKHFLQVSLTGQLWELMWLTGGCSSRNLWMQGDGHMGLQPWEPLYLALVGSSQALWPLLGQSFSPHIPKNTSWFQGVWSQNCGDTVGIGLAELPLVGSSGEPHILGFCKLQRCGKSVESFKTQEESKTGLNISGI